MTTIPNAPSEPRIFVTAKQAKGHPKPARTDEQIRAEMKESVQRNALTLKTLAKL